MIALKNIGVSFGEKRVLKDLNYEFPERGIVVVSGASGSGKTTLLRIICGLERNFDGELVTPPNFSVAMAFQEYRLFPRLSALKNLTEILYSNATALDEQRALSMLLRLGISEADAALLPSELSGGMKQRVSLARAFLREADALILDEPTKELDADHVRSVLELIKEQSGDRLVILVTHRESDIVALSDGVVGRIIIDSPTENFATKAL